MLRKFPAQLEAIQAQYMRDLAKREMSDDLLHDIARFLEDCQRVLDWTATNIDRAHGKSSVRSPYYPLFDSPVKFADAMKRDFPAVPKSVFDAMERHQPYQAGKASLGYLHDLARVNKHQDFTPQTRTETRRIRVSGGGGVVEWTADAVTFGSGVSILGVPIDPRTQRPEPSSTQEVAEIVYVGWNFLDPNVPVLPTLESLSQLIAEAVTDVRQSAGL
ncbi:MAG: hypothetical protein Q7T33_07285 [Dehalococcoidia bacterium]|nr:hypothetical protein [Dehalococcoidia bacterium]